MRIIPAIDIIDGKCVRLSRGDFNTKTIYNDNPVEVAKMFQDSGIQSIHLVDLDGAKAKHIINWKVLEEISNATSLIIDFGGGVRTDKDIEIAFNSGASQVTGGSIAVKSPEVFEGWLQKYGSEKLILGADAKNRRIATHGWEKDSGLDVVTFVQDYVQKGFTNVLCTDVAKDGMLEGPSLELYKELIDKIDGISLIASGGVTTLDDLYQCRELGCTAAVIGKAIYESKISLKELEHYQLEQN